MEKTYTQAEVKRMANRSLILVMAMLAVMAIVVLIINFYHRREIEQTAIQSYANGQADIIDHLTRYSEVERSLSHSSVRARVMFSAARIRMFATLLRMPNRASQAEQRLLRGEILAEARRAEADLYASEDRDLFYAYADALNNAGEDAVAVMGPEYSIALARAK